MAGEGAAGNDGRAAQDMFDRQVIDKHTKAFLSLHHPRAACFYIIPKIHKPGHPGRPIDQLHVRPKEFIKR